MRESNPELVVLMDDDGTPVGSASKSDVHGALTPLHLAFSCYLVDAAGDVLITRRALGKKTWPGVWTNTFCGHPAPGEAVEAAVHRRAAQELSATIRSLRPALPTYRYRAVDARGVMENEICPVYLGVLDGPFAPHPEEVAEWAWVSPEALATAVEATPFVFSPWMRDQVPQLADTGAFAALRR